MELRRQVEPRSQSNESNHESSSMSTLAIQAPSILPSPRDMAARDMWNDRRPLDLPSRGRSPSSQRDRVELPSIRQAVPEIQLGGARDESTLSRSDAASYSPTSGPQTLPTPPEYAQSPSQHKRRRLSNQEEHESEPRDRSVPRLYRSPPSAHRAQSVALSPTSTGRRVSGAESWSGSSRNSPFMAPRGLPAMRSPPPFEVANAARSSDWRPTLPSLPSINLDRGMQPQASQSRSSWSEYALEPARSGSHTHPPPGPSSFELPPSAYQQTPFGYGYQQPRGQSFSGPSPSHPMSHDRVQFSNRHNSGYPGGFPYALEMNEMGNDSKQRKRRGNLPKETTDKLRAWFVAHLQHPYPTEDEKQDLMRQTGLQMNQISNWFINARRRQLPAMINNARAESDARSARGNEGSHVYGEEREKDSDGDGSGYDDEYEALRQSQGMAKRERESI